MEKCLVSVIVPVGYVEKQVLLSCIRSIAGQTEKQIEILIVFDGTKECYEEILGDPVFADERLRIISKEHEGVSASRNRGLEQAKGAWVMFADADDRLSGRAVERLLAGASDHTDLVIGDYFIKKAKKLTAHSYKKEEYRVSSDNKEEFLEDILNPQTGMGFCWGRLYRTERIRTLGLRFCEELEMGEDAEFGLRYAIHAREILYLPCGIYFYQINPDSAVHRFREGYAGQYEKAMDRIALVLKENGYQTRLSEAFETCVLYHFLLITVNDSFHPENKKSRRQQIADYQKLTEKPLFAGAILRGNPKRFSLTRRITVFLIRLRFWDGVRFAAGIRHKQRKG